LNLNLRFPLASAVSYLEHGILLCSCYFHSLTQTSTPPPGSFQTPHVAVYSFNCYHLSYPPFNSFSKFFPQSFFLPHLSYYVCTDYTTHVHIYRTQIQVPFSWDSCTHISCTSARHIIIVLKPKCTPIALESQSEYTYINHN
jgi:hypothetical protein